MGGGAEKKTDKEARGGLGMGIAMEYLITAVFSFVPETCGVVLEHEERVWSVLLHGCTAAL